MHKATNERDKVERYNALDFNPQLNHHFVHYNTMNQTDHSRMDVFLIIWFWFCFYSSFLCITIFIPFILLWFSGVIMHPGPPAAALHRICQQPGHSGHGHLHGQLSIHDENHSGPLRVHRQTARNAWVPGMLQVSVIYLKHQIFPLTSLYNPSVNTSIILGRIFGDNAFYMNNLWTNGGFFLFSFIKLIKIYNVLPNSLGL